MDFIDTFSLGEEKGGAVACPYVETWVYIQV